MNKRLLWVLAVPAVALTAVLLMAGGAVSGGQHVEAAGNCLSFPVIFGEGSITLRGSPGYTLFEGESFIIDGRSLSKKMSGISGRRNSRWGLMKRPL